MRNIVKGFVVLPGNFQFYWAAGMYWLLNFQAPEFFWEAPLLLGCSGYPHFLCIFFQRCQSCCPSALFAAPPSSTQLVKAFIFHSWNSKVLFRSVGWLIFFLLVLFYPMLAPHECNHYKNTLSPSPYLFIRNFQMYSLNTSRLLDNVFFAKWIECFLNIILSKCYLRNSENKM